MKEMLDVTCTIDDILNMEDGALRVLCNSAITTVIADTVDPLKSKQAKRSVVINLEVARADQQVYIKYAVTPKLAPLTEAPERPKGKYPKGQIDMFGEVQE